MNEWGNSTYKKCSHFIQVQANNVNKERVRQEKDDDDEAETESWITQNG